jgi:hypothetical protein
MNELVSGSEGMALVSTANRAAAPAAQARQQLSFLADAHPVLERLRGIDLDRTTPLDALNLLQALKAKLDEGGEF